MRISSLALIAMVLITSTATLADVNRISCGPLLGNAPAVVEEAPHFSPDTGRPVTEGLSAAYHAKNQVFELGHGMGGTVYRLFPKDGSPERTIKLYFDELGLLQDQEGFKALEILTEGTGVFVTQRRNLGGGKLEIDTIYGRDLLKVWQSTEVPTGIRKKVIRKYEAFTQVLRERAAALFPDGVKIIEGPQPPVSFIMVLTKPSGEKIYLSIKPDNFIVDAKTLDLTIVDPY